MNSSFLTLTDILSYLLPGLLVSIAIIFKKFPDYIWQPKEKVGVGATVLVLAISYFIGILTFRASESVVIYPFKWYYDENILEGIIRKFPDLDFIKNSLQNRLNLTDKTNISVYRYVKVIVQEKAINSAISAERYITISHFFRNLIVCFPVALLVFLSSFKKFHKIKYIIISVVLIGIVEFGIAKAFLAFWSASVWEYFRAFVILECYG
ncbi:hypothetical protein D1614_22835 [Maribellus luteus]|uniref:Uncharacterized protein n=1 Tax=Maribellus luteus TaxID=2305463 RepID=A0A399SU46_9BACT|nr:hypothetical protein [Maribellus luteus]RIJ45507.1 hypothetical protein D1614_22835 [Maribellus luteus]